MKTNTATWFALHSFWVEIKKQANNRFSPFSLSIISRVCWGGRLFIIIFFFIYSESGGRRLWPRIKQIKTWRNDSPTFSVYILYTLDAFEKGQFRGMSIDWINRCCASWVVLSQFKILVIFISLFIRSVTIDRRRREEFEQTAQSLCPCRVIFPRCIVEQLTAGRCGPKPSRLFPFYLAGPLFCLPLESFLVMKTRKMFEGRPKSDPGISRGGSALLYHLQSRLY